MRRLVVALFVAVTVWVAPVTPVHAIDYRLEIINGTFNARPGDQLFFNVAMPSNADAAALLADLTASVVVQVSAPLVSRETAVAAARGESFAVDAELTLAGGAFRPIAIDATQAWQVVIPTAQRQTRQRLTVARDGLRAITVTITATTGVTAQLRTFVNLVANRNLTTLPVTFVAWLDAPPSVKPDGTVAVSDAVRDQLRDLRDLLARKPQAANIGVRIRPEVIDSLSRSADVKDQELFGQLVPLLADNDILVGTFRASSVPAYAAAQLRTQFDDQLVRGDATLDAVNGAALPSRAVWLSSEPLDSGAVEFLRGFGVTNVIMVGDAVTNYGADVNPNRPYALSAKSSTSSVSASSSVVLGLADPRYSTLLDEPVGTAHESAVALSAEIIAQRNEVAASFVGSAALSNRQVVLASARGVPPEPLIAALALRHLRSAPQISLVRTNELAPTLEGLPSIAAPNVQVVDVAKIQASTNAALESIAAVRDAIDPGSDIVARWTEILDIANDTNLNDTERAEYLGTVLDGVASVRNAVSLPQNSYTFGSRESQLRMTLANSSEYPLRLQVRLASAAGKMTFSPAVVDVSIDARGQREVFVAASARSNGLLTVELVLTTPSGVVLDSEQVRVRVNAIAGLGRWVSVVFLFILLLWWLLHLRRTHRKKRTQEHPALRSSP